MLAAHVVTLKLTISRSLTCFFIASCQMNFIKIVVNWVCWGQWRHKVVQILHRPSHLVLFCNSSIVLGFSSMANDILKLWSIATQNVFVFLQTKRKRLRHGSIEHQIDLSKACTRKRLNRKNLMKSRQLKHLMLKSRAFDPFKPSEFNQHLDFNHCWPFGIVNLL